MALQAGDYTADQIKSFGLSFDETVQPQYKDGIGYQLSNNNKGGRILTVLGSQGGNNVPQSYQSSGSGDPNMQKYLDNYNVALKNKQTADASIFKSPEDLKAEFDKFVTDPSGTKPTAPKLVDLYERLRSDGKLGDLETSLGDLKEQEALIEAALQESTMNEDKRTVAQNIIDGRINENYKRAQVELQFLGARKARIVDEIQGRYSTINTIISLTGQDYQNARQEYDAEFTKNLEMYKMIRGTQEKQADQAREDLQRAEDKLSERETMLLKFEREDSQRAEDAARSNLQIYSSALKSGNMDYGSLSEEQQLQINKLEVQAGLGVGFLSNLKQDNPEGEVKSITTRQDASGMKYADIIVKMPDGSLQVQSKALGAERLPEGSSSTNKVNEQSVIEKIIADYTDTGSGIGKAMRKQISPEDLVRKIRSEYPGGAAYLRDKEIDSTWLRENMR
jgi:hypothetical protein